MQHSAWVSGVQRRAKPPQYISFLIVLMYLFFRRMSIFKARHYQQVSIRRRNELLLQQPVFLTHIRANSTRHMTELVKMKTIDLRSWPLSRRLAGGLAAAPQLGSTRTAVGTLTTNVLNSSFYHRFCEPKTSGSYHMMSPVLGRTKLGKIINGFKRQLSSFY